MSVVHTSYSLRTGEAIKESVVRESTELAVDERVEDGESMAMPNEFYKNQCHVSFYSPFHISTALPAKVILVCTSFACLLYL